MPLGGEKIYPLTTKGLTTLDWIATKNVAKGDLVQLHGAMTFALEDANTGERVAVCIRCDLVDFPEPLAETVVGKDGPVALTPARRSLGVWRAGERISYHTKTDQIIVYSDWSSNKNNQPQADEWCGTIHEQSSVGRGRVRLCFFSYI